MNFEAAMKKLEKIVQELENGDISLEQSLEKFQEGIELSLFCSKKLEEAEKKVSILIEEQGSLQLKDFDIEG